MERRPDVPLPNIPSGPAQRPRASVSSPLADAILYRPGPSFALIILLIPVVTALVGGALYLTKPGPLPIWSPFVLLLWIPALVGVWAAMKTVRISSLGLAVGRPWGRWIEMEWGAIERVEQRGPLIVVFDTAHQRVSFAPALLVDGLRLRRQMLLRLQPQTLGGSLRQEAQSLITGDLTDLSSGGLTGVMRARPLPLWATLAALVAALALAAGVLGVLALPLPLALPLAFVALVVAVIGALLALWLRQQVVVDEKGIAVNGWPNRRPNTMPWEAVELLELGPGELAIRLRGERRLLCPGPPLFRAAERNRMRAFIHAYCLDRGTPHASRLWLL